MALEEFRHTRRAARLSADSNPETRAPTSGRRKPPECRLPSDLTAERFKPCSNHGKHENGSTIVDSERWHRTSYGGTLRAAVFGVNDGLLSNFGLVMGIVGTNAEPRALCCLPEWQACWREPFRWRPANTLQSISAELYEQQLELEKQELESSRKKKRKNSR